MADWFEYSDRVAQAAGIVSVQAECSVEDAFAMIEERAESTVTTVEHIAFLVVERQVRFAPQ